MASTAKLFCIRGHDLSQTRIRRKTGLSTVCKTCRTERSREFRAAHPEYNKLNSKKQYAADPEKAKAYNREHWHASHVKRNYGITGDEYAAMLEAQNYVCAICKRDDQVPGRRLSVDHDHATGKVRGLLCTNCNMCVGMMGDSPGVIAELLQYVKKHRQLEFNLPAKISSNTRERKV